MSELSNKIQKKRTIKNYTNIKHQLLLDYVAHHTQQGSQYANHKYSIGIWHVIGLVGMVFVGVGFIYLQLVTMQSTSQLYKEFVFNENTTVYQYISLVETLPEHQYYLQYLPKTYSSYKELQKEISLSDKEAIIELERVLNRQPQSRDVLYALAVLYEQNDEEMRSQEYLERAEAIDPLVDN